ncbi:MAG TPA: hypothetical protein VMT46_04830 [Anaerolineaceae bacterium]|nr:hypothetical protein [Anaerolineaceae bacterium]
MFRFGRLFLVLVLIGVVIAAASLVYHAGMDQGYQLGYYTAPRGEVSPAPAPAPYYSPYSYGPRFGSWGYGGFNPFGWLLGLGLFLLFLVVIGAVIRGVFFRGFARRGPWGWGMGGRGHGFWGSEPGEVSDKGEKGEEKGEKEWRGPWSGDVPPFFKEWHNRVHQQAEQTPPNPSESSQES